MLMKTVEGKSESIAARTRRRNTSVGIPVALDMDYARREGRPEVDDESYDIGNTAKLLRTARGAV